MQRKLQFLAYFFICATTAAQQYSFVYYTPKDGLVNSRVRYITQDSRGRMFFLTYGGLSIYDGTRFTNYHVEHGLANELVNDVLEITPDSFLIATNTNQLNVMVNGRIKTLKTMGDPVPVINKFFPANDGKLYVSGDEGLYILDQNRFRKISLAIDSVTVNYIDKITEWDNLLLLIPWDQSPLVVFNKASGKPILFYSEIKVNNITSRRDGKLWASTPKGIYEIDTGKLKKGKVVLQMLDQPYKDMIGNQVGNVMFSKKNDCFVYGDNRILKLSGAELQQISVDQGLKIGAANHVFEDREGLFWIASDGSGVVKWKGTEIKVINTIDGQQARVTAMANFGDTVWYYNSSTRKLHFMHPGGSGSFLINEKDFYAHSIYLSGQTVMLSDGFQLLIIKNKNSPAGYLQPEKIKNKDYGYGKGLIDPYGAFIFYTSLPGNKFRIAVMKKNRMIFTYPVTYTVDQMVIDKQNKLWLITRTNHLMRFSINPKEPLSYLKLEKDLSRPFKDAALRSLTIDSTGNVWLGTRYKGLIRVKFKGDEIDSLTGFTTKEGLSDNFIYSLSTDRNNTVWAGTQSGLDRIFLKNGHYIIGNTGRVNNWFQSGTQVLATPNGNVWTQTSEGSILNVTALNPVSNSHQPGLRFTSFQVNNQEWTMEKEFNHQQNNFSFSVAAPSFIDEKSIMYSYMLEGSHLEQWSEPSNMATFNLINLAPGKYTLRIKCEYPEEAYPPEYLSYSFLISPPWWKTWLFRISLIIALVAGSVLLVRFYYKRKMERQRSALEKQQAIEKERTRIATDMHDDLGAGLSRIKFLSETIGIKKQQQQPIEEDIDKIREYSHQMIDKMGEIVWALNEKNDSLSDLLAYTRAYAMEYLSQNGIACNWEMPETFPTVFVSGEFRRNIFLSTKEALHNIVKHAEADRVYIHVQTGKALVMSIHDNGKGFSRKNIRKFSNGLENIEKRMKDIGGRSEFKNIDGTSVILAAPLA